MAKRAILGVTAALPADKVEATRAKVAAHLGLAVEDVLVVHGASVTVVDVPEAKRETHAAAHPAPPEPPSVTTSPASWKKSHTEK